MTASRYRITGMNFRQALGEVIRQERLAQERTMRSITDGGFIALGYLSEVERGQKDPSSEVMEAIANGLGVEPYELIIKAGYKMADLEIPDTPESLFSSSLFANSR
jgi:transcriptional regulator with XRE-family HTH domain